MFWRLRNKKMEKFSEKNKIDAINKENKSKHAALWCGLIFFLVLISFLWGLNNKNLFSFLKKEEGESFDFGIFSQEFKNSLEKGVERIDDFMENSASTTKESNNEIYEERQEELFRE